MKEQIEEMAVDLCLIDRCKRLPQEECNNTTCAHCEAEALYNAGYRKQEWISVDDRLPEKEGVYLVHTTYNIIETEVFYISKHDDISYWWDLDRMVTHWMPLPEPPKAKGGEADA